MNNYNLYISFFLFMIHVVVTGQHDTSTIFEIATIQNQVYDDKLCNDSDFFIPYSIIRQEGFLVSYFYKSDSDYFNYNIIFIPSSEITIPLIKNIVKKSIVSNRKKPLLEQYFTSVENIKEFESLFKYSLVVAHDFRYESDSFNINGINNKCNLNLLASEIYQFHESGAIGKTRSIMKDSIGIIFKLFPVEGVFRLESYNPISQKYHYNVMCSDSNYNKERKAIYIHIFGEMRMCRLDCRFLSPILSQIIVIEFKERTWRRFVSKMFTTT